jgi:hypothetical protein
MPRKLIEAVAKDGAKLEPEQDLRPKDQHARFVEGYFDLLDSSMRVA